MIQKNIRQNIIVGDTKKILEPCAVQMEKINADKCSMIKMILIKVTTRTKPFWKLCLTINVL